MKSESEDVIHHLCKSLDLLTSELRTHHDPNYVISVLRLINHSITSAEHEILSIEFPKIVSISNRYKN